MALKRGSSKVVQRPLSGEAASFRLRYHPELPPAAEPTNAWSFGLGVAAFFAALLGALVLVVLLALLAEVFGGSGYAEEDPTGLLLLFSALMVNLSLLFTALGFARMKGRLAAWQFGLRRFKIGPAVGWGVLGWVVMAICSALLMALYVALTGQENEGNTAELVDGLSSSPQLFTVLMALNISLLTGICEELFFRGFLFNALRHWKGAWLGVLVSSLLFASVHFSSSASDLIFPFCFGVALCLLYLKTGSIVPGIVLHGLHNGVVIAVAFGWSWQIVPLLVVVVAGQILVLHRFLAPRYIKA